eukprot:TRINITY_DN13054_c0_g1_i1.p1 TRINITY_DN13054_c0_g1~~TRINITY_DN13054_c0_g1_i1.p1  ORF type:complete len:275 (+),score=46.93 TRINITY_DN13054_c0_g1_i1:41-826(+)
MLPTEQKNSEEKKKSEGSHRSNPYNLFKRNPHLLNEPSRCPIFLLRSRDQITEGRKSVSERHLVGETIEKPDVPVLLEGMAEVLFLALQRGNSQEVPKKDPWIFYNPYIGATGPNKSQIHRFISDLIVDHKVVAECGVMAIAYLDRYLALVAGACIHTKNIFPLVTTAIILATKVYEDDSVFNEDFLPTVSFFSSKDLSEMEKLFLSQLDFRVNIKASVYAQYFFEICKLSPEVHSEKVPAPANSAPKMATARRTKSVTTM